MRLHQALNLLINRVIYPRSTDKDKARREFILNILLVGLLILTATGFLINLLHPFLYPSSEGQNPFITGSILIFILILLVLSRLGRSQIAALIFIWMLFVVGCYMAYYWGADLPALLLFFAMLIVMSGILIDAKFAFTISVLSGGSIIFFSYLEIAHILEPHVQWKKEMIHMVDSVVFVIILEIIAVVSWLSNREMEIALKRARASEAAVKRQRDNLEVLVAKRTKELRQSQAEKLSQLYHFAEFGKMASGLFHDLANPLALVSLNLDRLRRQSKNIDQQKISDTKIMLQRALSGTHRLEKFIQAARKQIQNQDVLQLFSLKEEVDQSIQVLGYKARKMHVTIERRFLNDIRFYGNPVRFNQLVTNLVSNAIDSYENVSDKNRKVEIRIAELHNEIRLEIQDWGSGIEKKNLDHIFEPLFTTKPQDKGMGIGLSISRDTVRKYLKGTIQVESNKNSGTKFIVTFPIVKPPKRSND